MDRVRRAIHDRQGPVRERAAVFEKVVAHVADHLELRLDQVLVDTVRSDRVLSGGRGKPHGQHVEVQEMRDAAQRLGFRLGAPAGIAACFMPPGVTDEPCELGETGVGLMINAPDIAGANATVTFVYFPPSPDLTLGEPRVSECPPAWHTRRSHAVDRLHLTGDPAQVVTGVRIAVKDRAPVAGGVARLRPRSIPNPPLPLPRASD